MAVGISAIMAVLASGMAYYRIRSTGGAAEERAAFAIHMGFRPFSPTAARGVYYLDHSAAADVVQRSYQSTAGPNVLIEVEEISGDDFRMRR